MKIQILSDTHNSKYTLLDKESVDVVVHAGDFSNGLKGIKPFVEECLDKGVYPIFVPGNHEYYRSSIKATMDFLKTSYKDFVLLDGNAIAVNGKTFVGGTLFTNFRANKLMYTDSYSLDKNKEYAKQYVNDFNVILSDVYKNKAVSPDEYITNFNICFNNILRYKNKDVIVVTHFPPHLCCLDPYWGSHPVASSLNPYFINDCLLNGFKNWIAGHTHTAVDTVVDGCRVVINPLGYPSETNTGYESCKVIEV